jgi:hypothetical protein
MGRTPSVPPAVSLSLDAWPADAKERAQAKLVACAAFVLAGGFWLRFRWLPALLATGTGNTAVMATLITAFGCVEACTLWCFSRMLIRNFGFHGARRYAAVLAAVFLVDTVVHLQLILTGARGFEIYRALIASYQVGFSYLFFLYLVLGTACIAFGYSVLRLGDELHGLLAGYGWAQVWTGAALTSFVLVPFAWLPAIAAHLLLGVIFYRLACGPVALRRE